MSVLRHASDKDGKNGVWILWCPGCEQLHQLDERWTKTGTDEKPTFRPSLVTHLDKTNKCHLFVREGRLQFLGDCWHKLAGQTVEMKEFDW